MAIGNVAGNYEQGNYATAIGNASGKTSQGLKCVAIGMQAGEISQGANSVAIGNLAGQTSQHANSIVLNGTGSALNTDAIDRFFVKPIRGVAHATSVGQLSYDSATGEMTHSTTASLPYYIEIDIGDSGGGGIFSAAAQTLTILDNNSAITTPISNYDADVGSTNWSPSIDGLYIVIYKAQIRSVNADYLVESRIEIERSTSGGAWSTVALASDRNWGSSVNEADARVFSMSHLISYTVYATTADDFRFKFYGASYFGNAIWLMTGNDRSKMSVYKLV